MHAMWPSITGRYMATVTEEERKQTNHTVRYIAKPACKNDQRYMVYIGLYKHCGNVTYVSK